MIETPRKSRWVVTGSWAPVLGVWLAFFLWSVLVYWGLWNTQFYKDDYDWLTIGRDIARSPLFLFTPDPVNREAVVRVLQRIVLAGIYSVSGLESAGYHLVSLVLHALASTLVFFLLRELLQRAVPDRSRVHRVGLALLGAFVFSTSHNHSSAVVWASSMSTLLVTCALVALFGFVLRHESRLHEPRFFTMVIAAYLLALASKSTAVSFSLFLGLYFWIGSPARRHPWARVGLVAILLLLGVTHAVWSKVLLGGVDLVEMIRSETGTYAFARNVPFNLLGAFLGSFVPAGLYEWWFPDRPFQYAALVVLAFVGVLVWLSRYRRQILLGAAWIFVTALPVSLFNYQQYDAIQIMANRYYYLPLVGSVVLVTFVLLWLCDGWKPRHLGIGITLAMLLHAALHVPVLRQRVQGAERYGRPRMKLIHLTLETARQNLPAGSVIYAEGWDIPPPYFPRISSLYFEEHGFRLLGMDEWERVRQQDSIPRFVARFRADTSEFEMQALASAP